MINFAFLLMECYKGKRIRKFASAHALLEGIKIHKYI